MDYHCMFINQAPVRTTTGPTPASSIEEIQIQGTSHQILEELKVKWASESLQNEQQQQAMTPHPHAAGGTEDRGNVTRCQELGYVLRPSIALMRHPRRGRWGKGWGRKGVGED